MELFDTHCHIQSAGQPIGEHNTRQRWAKAGAASVDDIIERARAAAVARLLCVGCDLEDSQLAITCAEVRDNCWAAIGIHPHEARRYIDNARARAAFVSLAAGPKVVAIGECGLDFFYEHSPKVAQLKLLKFQIELAQEHDLPVVFHIRDAFADFWPIFEQYMQRAPIRGIVHSFTGSAADLEKIVQHGLLVGVNGIATFTKLPEQQAIYKTIPLESLVLETDAPFLTPHPERGSICEPYHIRVIAEFLAAERHESVETIAEVTTQNARRLFNV